MSQVKSVRLEKYIVDYIESMDMNISSYIKELIVIDMKNSVNGKLFIMVEEVIRDINERQKELMIFRHSKEFRNKPNEYKKVVFDELKELSVFVLDLEELLQDINADELSFKEGIKLIDDIRDAVGCNGLSINSRQN